MTFRKKQSAKVMVPVRWDQDGGIKANFYHIKAYLQDKYPDRVITNDAVFEYCVTVVFETEVLGIE